MTKLKERTIPRRDRAILKKLEFEETRTEQAHKETTDINVILKDYARTGFMRHAKENAGVYDDVSSVDFEKAMQTVATVNSLFEGLPSGIRKEFGNNPGAFLEYVQDPANHQILESRGILIGNDGIDITGAYVGSPVKKTAPVEGVPTGTPDSGPTSPEGASESQQLPLPE